MSTQFDTLGRELDAEAFRWLGDAHPGILAAVEDAVTKGATAEQVRRYVLGRVGGERHPLATRIEGAARHISAQMARA